MGMQKPAYKVKIGTETLDSSANPEIISIIVDLDIDVPIDSFKIALKPSSRASSIRIGDPVIIELGYEGALSRVLTGAVDAVETKVSQVEVRGLSLVSLLTIQRVNQVYEKQTAGAIVKDLAERAGIAVKMAEDGLSLPMYVVDETKDVYTHMKELAGRCGFDLFLGGDGRLVFKRYSQQAPKQFKFGRDIIEAEVHEPLPVASCVRVFGESPSSFKGAETAHWVAKRSVEGMAGRGEPVLSIEDPLVRDKDTADKVAAAVLEAITGSISGTVKALGNARMGLGDTIGIKEMPERRMNGEFEARKITHIFSKGEGFVSLVGWERRITITPAEPPLAPPPRLPAPSRPSPLEEQLESAKDDLEDKRLKLQDAVEAAEMDLERSQMEISNALAEQERLGRELIEAAEEAKKKADEASGEALAGVGALKKELESRKAEIEGALAKSKAKLEEYGREAQAQVKGYEEEIQRLKDEAERAAAEVRARFEEEGRKAKERLRGLEEEAMQARGQLGEWRRKAEEGEQRLAVLKEEMLKKTGPAREAAEKQLKDLESAVKEARDKASGLEKEMGEKAKELEGAASEAGKVEEGIEREVEERSKEAEAKAEELRGKADEVKKEAAEAEKRLQAEEEEARRKLQGIEQEVQVQIEETKKTAERLKQEAEEKLVQAREKAEKTRREAGERLEKMNKTYNEARDKVLEARKQVGMD
jgi:hypothetical protein